MPRRPPWLYRCPPEPRICYHNGRPIPKAGPDWLLLLRYVPLSKPLLLALYSKTLTAHSIVLIRTDIKHRLAGILLWCYFLAILSLTCLSNSLNKAQPCCRVSGATGANVYKPTLHEWNKKSQSDYKKMEYAIRHRSRYRLPLLISTSHWNLDRCLCLWTAGSISEGRRWRRTKS